MITTIWARGTAGLAAVMLLQVVIGIAHAQLLPVPSQPPAGAITANAAYPSIGSKWKIRVTVTGRSLDVAGEREVAAVPLDFNGHSAYGLADLVGITAYNPTNFNLLGTVKGGKIATILKPEGARFSWPLWIGKSWSAPNSFVDIENGINIPYVEPHFTVAAYEDVTVPAGTFKAFRIEQSPGPSISSTATYWYAPAPKIVVKLISRRTRAYYLGEGQTDVELLTLPK